MKRTLRCLALAGLLLAMCASAASASTFTATIDKIIGTPSLWSYELVLDVSSDFTLQTLNTDRAMPAGWNIVADQTPAPVSTLRVLGVRNPYEQTVGFLQNGALCKLDYLGSIQGVSASTGFYYTYTGSDPYGNPPLAVSIGSTFFTSYNLYGTHVSLASFSAGNAQFLGEGVAAAYMSPALLLLPLDD